MHRSLRLTKETLAELSASELAAVAGGAIPTEQCLTGIYPTLPVAGCIEDVTKLIGSTS